MLSKGQGGDGQHVPQTHSCAVPATALAQGSDGSSHIHSITARTAEKWSPWDSGSLGFGASLGFGVTRIQGIPEFRGLWDLADSWDLESLGFGVPGIQSPWDLGHPQEIQSSEMGSQTGLCQLLPVMSGNPHGPEGQAGLPTPCSGAAALQ